VRVIDDDGQQLGIMPPPQAVAIARQKGLDLVEISPTAQPPVCRVMDYGKYQYLEQKRARQARKHQKVIEVKEIKFRPKVDEHDYQFKKKHIERFLAAAKRCSALPAADRHALLQKLIVMARADGRLADEEVRALHEAAGALGATPGFVDQVVKLFE